MKTDPNAPKPTKPALTSPQPLAGKPWARTFPTPRIEDYIVSVRQDTRAGGFKMPRKGSKFKGVDEHKLLNDSFRFAKSVPVEQLPGFVDLFYLRPFHDQEAFNWTVAYPYVDKHYPQITRTYFCMRSDYAVIKEPDADTADPTSPDLFLTDHKIERFENDPVLDSLFVKVIRVFERLPSPIITSFGVNQFQQEETITTQEVVSGPPPAQSGFTEEAKQERIGTAKAKDTIVTVPRIFPSTELSKKREYPIPAVFQKTIPLKTTSQVVAGDGPHVAVMPTLGVGDSDASQVQTTEFKKKVATSHYDTVDDEVDDQRLTEQQQVETLDITIHKGEQDITPAISALTSSAETTHIGDGDTVMKIGTVDSVFPATELSAKREYPIPPVFQAFIPLKRTSQVSEGQAVMPALGVGDSDASQVQTTEFKKKTETSHYDTISVDIGDQKMTEQQQLETLTQTIQSGKDGAQDITPALSALTTSAEMMNLPDGDTVMKIGTVDSVFPQAGQKREIPSMTRELWLGGFQEFTDSLVEAGQVTDPVLSPGVYSLTGDQITEFKKKTTTLSLPLPQARHHKELTKEFGGGVVLQDMNIESPTSGIDIDQGTLIIESRLRNLEEFGKIRETKRLDGAAWPNLHEEKILTDGIYAGIKVLIDKQVVAAGLQPDGSGPPYTPNPTPNPPRVGGPFTDMMPIDKWRTIQVTSAIDLNTLPSPLTYVASHPLNIPPTLLSVGGVVGDRGGYASSVSHDGNDGEGVSVTVDSGPLGAITHSSIEGFRGNALALITRIFLTSPPQVNGDGSITANGHTYRPFKFLAASGVATLISTYAKFSGAISGPKSGPGSAPGGSASSSSQGQTRIQAVEFRPMFTGAFIQTPLQYYQGQSGPTSGPVLPTRGAHTTDWLYQLDMAILGDTSAKLVVTMPPSSPAFAPTSGTQLLAAVDVAEWRFGIWVLHLVNVIVP